MISRWKVSSPRNLLVLILRKAMHFPVRGVAFPSVVVNRRFPEGIGIMVHMFLK